MPVEEAIDEATNEIKETLQRLLDERFKGELEFGPIVVKPKYDEDGVRYLRSYVVFKGDQKKLDPSWTVGLSRKIWDRSEELGFPGIPDQWFVGHEEWRTFKQHVM